MKDTNYINIQGWMINRLKLSGNKLIVYAVIYGFSQDEKSKYAGSAGYLAECAGISRQAVMEILKSLTKDGLLVKAIRTENDVKFCDYCAVIPCKETLHPPVKKLDTPCKETLHPPVKKLDTILNINITRDKQKDKESGFVFSDENKLPEPPVPDDDPPDDKPIETKENAIVVWNKARELWNKLGLKPPCRDLTPRADYMAEILRTVQLYSWGEIKDAIENFAWHKLQAGPEFRPPPPYGSLAGFLKAGVEKYHDTDALDQQFKEYRK